MKKALIVIITMLCLTAYAQNALTEEQKITLLIESVKELPDGTQFIRNGKAYNAEDAANHLRGKYNRTKNRIKTAEDFITHLASKSSVSGKEYQIATPNGVSIDTHTFFTRKLAEIDNPTE